ncbi:putative dienelactone hydrolase, alpha/Beta hydrolase [Helianthus annuus]|nr:putative dienelactone hydrolase, alpha/Beta hydrolase [Helianthus annuus]
MMQLADKVAAAGYYVLVPDFFHGDPLTSINKLGDWRKNHAPEQAVEFAKPVIQALKEKGITKIGAAGFCWGGKTSFRTILLHLNWLVVVELAKDAEIQFAALLHPSFVTLDDIKGMFYSTTFIIIRAANKPVC